MKSEVLFNFIAYTACIALVCWFWTLFLQLTPVGRRIADKMLAKRKRDLGIHQLETDLVIARRSIHNLAITLGYSKESLSNDGVYFVMEKPAGWGTVNDIVKSVGSDEKKSDSNVRTSSDSKFKIRFESVTLPNTKKADRDALRVHFSHPVFDGYPENVEVGSGDVAIFNLSALFSQISGNRDQQLFLKAIWEIGHISRVSEFNPFSCVIYKSGASTWEESEVVVLEAIFEFFRDKYSETEEEE